MLSGVVVQHKALHSQLANEVRMTSEHADAVGPDARRLLRAEGGGELLKV